MSPRHVDRRHGDRPQCCDVVEDELRRHDPVFVIERRMVERGALRIRVLADVEPDARIAFAAVPVAPVPFDLAEPDRQLIDRRLELLQAEHVGLLPVEEILKIRLAGPDAIDVPGCDFHPPPRHAPFRLSANRAPRT
jgi:hypothetical protein